MPPPYGDGGIITILLCLLRNKSQKVEPRLTKFDIYDDIVVVFPCQSATSECSPPLPGSDSGPKSVVGVSHGVFHSRLKTHLFFRSFPP